MLSDVACDDLTTLSVIRTNYYTCVYDTAIITAGCISYDPAAADATCRSADAAEEEA